MKSGTLIYGDISTDYSIVISNNLNKKILIHVYPNGHVKVEMPQATAIPEVHQAVKKRARWIMNQLKAGAETRAHVLSREYISGETHFYLGRRYQLKIHETNIEPTSVKLVSGNILIKLRINDRAAVKSRLQNWYKDRAVSYLSRRLDLIVDGLSWVDGVPPLKLVRMQKQWGSCSPSGTINLNSDLIKAPRDCIDYVIAHELCHLIEHNHSKKYYLLLDACYPNWRHTKFKLDNMAELLLAI
ncbi:MAG: M48 family metallopeptidase [Proteobacteria bacterium]|nr:M48 family metallopeptidase [Pseudomonadota bacterium]